MNQQCKFETVEEYYEWRTYWRRQYTALAKEIRYYKNKLKEGSNDKNVQGLLRRSQMLARGMMIARESTECEHLTGFVAWAQEKQEAFTTERVRLRKELGLPEKAGRSVLKA